MLQLNYKLTDEDYIEFNEFHQLIHSEVGKRNLFKLYSGSVVKTKI